MKTKIKIKKEHTHTGVPGNVDGRYFPAVSGGDTYTKQTN